MAKKGIEVWSDYQFFTLKDEKVVIEKNIDDGMFS